jgi:hypothetical protein
MAPGKAIGGVTDMFSAAHSRSFRIIRSIVLAQLLCLLTSIAIGIGFRTAQECLGRVVSAGEINSIP